MWFYSKLHKLLGMFVTDFLFKVQKNTYHFVEYTEICFSNQKRHSKLYHEQTKTTCKNNKLVSNTHLVAKMHVGCVIRVSWCNTDEYTCVFKFFELASGAKIHIFPDIFSDYSRIFLIIFFFWLFPDFADFQDYW